MKKLVPIIACCFLAACGNQQNGNAPQSGSADSAKSMSATGKDETKMKAAKAMAAAPALAAQQSQIYSNVFAINYATVAALSANPVVAIVQGLTSATPPVGNFAVLPLTSIPQTGGTGTILPTTATACAVQKAVECPIYCDVSNLTKPSFVAGSVQPNVKIATVKTDVTNFNKANPGVYNCLVVNAAYLQTLANLPAATTPAIILVSVGIANGNLFLNYMCIDATGKLVGGNTNFNDTNPNCYISAVLP